MDDSNGETSKFSLLPKLVPQDILKQWMDMQPPPPQLAGNATSCEEAKHWIAFAKSFDESSNWNDKLQSLDSHLLKQSVVCGLGTTISPVDIVVFLAVRDIVVNNVIFTTEVSYQNVIRWFDYVQDEDKVASFFQRVHIRKSAFEPQDFSDVIAKKLPKVDLKVSTAECIPSSNPVPATKEVNEEQLSSNAKNSVKFEENVKDKSLDNRKKAKDNKDNQGASKKEEKKGKENNTSALKKEDKKGDVETSVSSLDIRIGLVVKVWKHPSADSLLVEEIDLGEGGIRQVVSGLAKYLKEEQLLNRKVVLIANVKPGKLRDVMSAGLVLCASDHSMVEPLIAPDGAVVGERITFAGHEGKPEEVLNPKKKQLEKILPDLFTDENCLATYQGIPFMTSAGPCTSSLAKAAIK